MNIKKLLVLFIAITLANCSSNDTLESLNKKLLIGRWNVEGFEGNVLFEFTDDKRYTLYSGNGVFETLQEVISSGRPGNDWYIQDDKVIIDLHFGNILSSTPKFKCKNNVIEWMNDKGDVTSVYFKEGYTLSECK